MKKSLLIIIWSIMMLHNLSAQSKSGIENYNFLSSKEAYVWMPVAHHVGKKGLYTEMRYNYEALRTASVYAGKSYAGEGIINYTITPMLGIVLGNYNGASLATNIDLEYKKTFISMQSQYTVSRDGAEDNFFFNWTELGYQPIKWFYTGVSAQLTKGYKEKLIAEYGMLVGFIIKKFTIPVYVFNPLRADKNFIVGVNMEW